MKRHATPKTDCNVVGLQRKVYYGGTFKDPREAAKAFDKLALKILGRGALLHFPEELDPSTAGHVGPLDCDQPHPGGMPSVRKTVQSLDGQVGLGPGITVYAKFT